MCICRAEILEKCQDLGKNTLEKCHYWHVCSLEVKSGKDYERHNALKNVMENKHYGIVQVYVLSNGNLSTKERVMYLPIYMLMFIQKRATTEKQIYRFDLSHLGSE